MVTRTTTPIDYALYPESDGEPMAETIKNAFQMVQLQFHLSIILRLRGWTRFALGGNQFMYYTEGNGRDHVSPDVYVALDVEPGMRPIWQTWVEGKFPDIVFEITSPSTERIDLTKKVDLYTRLGAREYYIYDPQQVMRPPFRAFQLVRGRMEPLPALPDGSIVSPLLDCEFRIVEEYLRIIDPVTGEPMLFTEEVLHAWEDLKARIGVEEGARIEAEILASRRDQARLEAEARMAQEGQARRQAEARAAQEERARLEAETRMAQEGRARLEAEARAARAEAELRDLRAQLARRSPPAADTDGTTNE